MTMAEAEAAKVKLKREIQEANEHKGLAALLRLEVFMSTITLIIWVLIFMAFLYQSGAVAAPRIKDLGLLLAGISVTFYLPALLTGLSLVVRFARE